MESLLIRQADYCRSPLALESARNIVAAKVRNCRLLLTRYIARARRGDQASAGVLAETKKRIAHCGAEVTSAYSNNTLLLIEARAAAAYASALSALTRQDSWRRLRTEPPDMLNLLLNIGYHLLSLECEKALAAAGLYLEVGLLHGASSGKPLLYDFIEQFRQPTVDCIVLPLFSRKRVSSAGERDKARFLKRFGATLGLPCWYKNRCETMRRIIVLEAYVLRKAVEENKPYLPYQHRWGNSSPCNKKAPPLLAGA